MVHYLGEFELVFAAIERNRYCLLCHFACYRVAGQQVEGLALLRGYYPHGEIYFVALGLVQHALEESLAVEVCTQLACPVVQVVGVIEIHIGVVLVVLRHFISEGS